MNFCNYTPHEINIVLPTNKLSFASMGVARVTESQRVLGMESGIELRETVYGEIEGLPESKDDCLIIVSLLVKQVNAKSKNPRKDLVIPDTGASCIRENGQIKAVTGFVV